MVVFPLIAGIQVLLVPGSIATRRSTRTLSLLNRRDCELVVFHTAPAGFSIALQAVDLRRPRQRRSHPPCACFSEMRELAPPCGADPTPRSGVFSRPEQHSSIRIRPNAGRNCGNNGGPKRGLELAWIVASRRFPLPRRPQARATNERGRWICNLSELPMRVY